MEMNIAPFILFIISTIGLTNIVVYSDFYPIEKFKEFMKSILHKRIYDVFECTMCFGFWAGLFCGYHLLTTNSYQVFLCGCAGSFACSLTTNIVEYITSNSNFVLNEEDINDE